MKISLFFDEINSSLSVPDEKEVIRGCVKDLSQTELDECSEQKDCLCTDNDCNSKSFNHSSDRNGIQYKWIILLVLMIIFTIA